MSVPNTGHFEIELEDGSKAIFNGRQWTSENRELIEKLNVWRPYIGGTHSDVRELATEYLEQAQIREFRIIKIEYDGWEHDLPEGWID